MMSDSHHYNLQQHLITCPAFTFMSTKLVPATLICLTLLGCQPDVSSTTPGERALANLGMQLKQDAMDKARPVTCDNGGMEQRTLTCHADLMQSSGADERKVGSVAYTCSTVPGGSCEYIPAADAARASSRETTCNTALSRGMNVDVQDVGAVNLSELATHDVPGDTWANASFTLQDTQLRLTEAQVRRALERLADHVANACGSAPLKKLRVFLYPAGVTAGESMNWIAKLDDPGSGRNIELHRQLLKDERTDRYACVNGKEPGKSLDLGTRLPPERQRKLIGTWADSTDKVTMSLERVADKVYIVYRSAYCGSGNRGELVLTRPGDRYAMIDSRNGDYFQVLLSGDLGVFDRDGRIDVMPKHEGLYPAAVNH